MILSPVSEACQKRNSLAVAVSQTMSKKGGRSMQAFDIQMFNANSLWSLIVKLDAKIRVVFVNTFFIE
jgi:hypothetical protein